MGYQDIPAKPDRGVYQIRETTKGHHCYRPDHQPSFHGRKNLFIPYYIFSDGRNPIHIRDFVSVNIEIDFICLCSILYETAKTIPEPYNRRLKMDVNVSSPEKDISSSYYAMSQYFYDKAMDSCLSFVISKSGTMKTIIVCTDFPLKLKMQLIMQLLWLKKINTGSYFLLFRRFLFMH